MAGQNSIKMENKSWLINYLLIIIILCSCNGKRERSNQDYFYSDTGGFDLKRIPLLKPYEAKLIDENNWRVRLETTQLLELSIQHIRKVNIIDSIILLYASGDISIKAMPYPEGWFVIIPSRQEEFGFHSESDYLQCLRKLGIRSPELVPVEMIYDSFKKNKKLDWPIAATPRKL